MLPILLATLVGYFLGAIPFAVVVARAHGVDILKAGSGNPGATNVKRVVGRKAGNLVFFLDVLKGFTATVTPYLWAGFFSLQGNMTVEYLTILGLLGAIIGHSFSIFLGGRGGKGVAVTIGGLSALIPIPLLLGLLVWVICFYTTRFVSLASLAFALSLPFSVWHFYDDTVFRLFAISLAAIIFVRHGKNIRSLFAGQENRFGQSDKDSPPPA